jgi:hypothetical protein
MRGARQLALGGKTCLVAGSVTERASGSREDQSVQGLRYTDAKDASRSKAKV